MIKMTVLIFLMFSYMASAQDAPVTLEGFNHAPPWDGTSAEVSDDPDLIAQFNKKEFVCRDSKQFEPKESDAAVRAFGEFVEYSVTGDKVEDFWMDNVHRQKREALLSAALKAESWKAKFVDSTWTLRRSRDAVAKQNAQAKLIELVEKGVPIVAYKYATYLFGRDGKSMYYLLDAAIDRGSPHAMTWVGTTIVVQSKALRPLGRALLECAASQGHAHAYEGLGVLADMEGRRLDAYRSWEKGVNEGCEKCIPRLMGVARVRNDSPNKPLEESMPELVRIKKFYQESTFYSLSELPEFEPRLPNEWAFHLADEELLSLLKFEWAWRKM